MVVVISLIGAAESKEMIALQYGDVIAKELVLAIPEAHANVLSIHVVRNERGGGKFTKRLERASEPRGLHHTAGIIP